MRPSSCVTPAGTSTNLTSRTKGMTTHTQHTYERFDLFLQYCACTKTKNVLKIISAEFRKHYKHWSLRPCVRQFPVLSRSNNITAVLRQNFSACCTAVFNTLGSKTVLLLLIVDYYVRTNEAKCQARTKEKKQTTTEKTAKTPPHIEQSALMRMIAKLC